MGFFLLKTTLEVVPKSCRECKLCHGWDLVSATKPDNCPVKGVIPSPEELKVLLTEYLTDFDCEQWAKSPVYRKSFIGALLKNIGIASFKKINDE